MYTIDSLEEAYEHLNECADEGRRDIEFEKALLTTKGGPYRDVLIAYAVRVIEGPWPELEQLLLDEYTGLTGDLASIFKRSPTVFHAANYAKKVLKGRWAKFEELIRATPGIPPRYDMSTYCHMVVREPAPDLAEFFALQGEGDFFYFSAKQALLDPAFLSQTKAYLKAEIIKAANLHGVKIDEYKNEIDRIASAEAERILKKCF